MRRYLLFYHIVFYSTKEVKQQFVKKSRSYLNINFFVLNMNYKVSIVVPIYNVEQYLKQCLESIGMFDRNDIEIILVNDGSTDKSLGICQEYAQLYNNASSKGWIL